MAEEISTSHSEEKATQFNLMQTVKRRLFAMRNGALAAQMRSGGLNYRINFGLNIPQVKEIATDIINMGLDRHELLGLANALWENENTRESRLTAPMIYPPEEMTAHLAAEWLRQAQTIEIADHLCHSLLRKLPFAGNLANEVLSDKTASDINRYTALRLTLNLMMLHKTTAAHAREVALAEQQRQCRLTAAIAARIIEEADFMTE